MTDTNPTADEPEYGLVMPFVVCQSMGGPFHDPSFVAGWWCGHIDTQLGSLPPEADRFGLFVGIRSDLVPQLDLIAMHRGFALTTKPDESGDFVFATFERMTNEETP